MLAPLDPIVRDKLATGGILTALKLSRWLIDNPDAVGGFLRTPPAIYRVIEAIRSHVWDAVDDGSDINRSQEHADAAIEAMGLTGFLERVNAIEHLRRTGAPGADELANTVVRQVTGAITRLTAALAEPAAPSN